MRSIAMLLLCWGLSCAVYAQGIRFEEGLTWEQVQQKAKKEKKMILVDAYATWCGPCKQMEKEVYPDAALGAFVNDRFVAVKVQIDQTEQDNSQVKAWYSDAEKIQRQYRISELPAFLFLDANGNVLYRETGFHPAYKFLITCKTAADPSKNFAGRMKQFRSGRLHGQPLLELALQAKKYGEDTAALEAARAYRAKVLDRESHASLLRPEVLPVFGEFADVYHVDDAFIRYIYEHQAEADKGFGQPGVTSRIVNFMITRDLVYPLPQSPDWQAMQTRMAGRFDARTAKQVLLPAKVGYYEKRKDWDKMIAAWFEKIDTLGIDMKDIWGGVEVNNTIYNIIFKYSSDPAVLAKSIQYMEALLAVDPNSASRMDTYACVLYKAGYKEKAIVVERQALKLAEEKKNQHSAGEYRKVIEKMEAGTRIWE